MFQIFFKCTIISDIIWASPACFAVIRGCFLWSLMCNPKHFYRAQSFFTPLEIDANESADECGCATVNAKELLISGCLLIGHAVTQSTAQPSAILFGPFFGHDAKQNTSLCEKTARCSARIHNCIVLGEDALTRNDRPISKDPCFDAVLKYASACNLRWCKETNFLPFGPNVLDLSATLSK